MCFLSYVQYVAAASNMDICWFYGGKYWSLQKQPEKSRAIASASFLLKKVTRSACQRERERRVQCPTSLIHYYATGTVRMYCTLHFVTPTILTTSYVRTSTCMPSTKIQEKDPATVDYIMNISTVSTTIMLRHKTSPAASISLVFNHHTA